MTTLRFQVLLTTVVLLLALAFPCSALGTVPGASHDWQYPVTDSVSIQSGNEYDVFLVLLDGTVPYEFVLSSDDSADLDMALYGPELSSVEDDYDSAVWCEERDGELVVSGQTEMYGWHALVVFGLSDTGTQYYTVRGGFMRGYDDIPGLPLGENPQWYDQLNTVTDVHDVWYTQLNAGDKITLQLNQSAPSGGFRPVMRVFGPDAKSVRTDVPLAQSGTDVYPSQLVFVASVPGNYYIDVWSGESPTMESGGYHLFCTYVRTPYIPVYRFYAARTNHHFYTASAEERDNVLRWYPQIYRLEGVAYSINTANTANSTPLHRFYNYQNETHFYTASEAEKANVLATLRWKYRYDGLAYNVSAAPVPGATAVYRFYNRKVGTHFYTASAAERDYVASALGGTWTFEGPGYYVAP